jgi:hypothetical protein
MKLVSVSCGTNTNKHPKSMVVEDVREAYRLVRCHDPADLNYVVVTIHLVKEDLGPSAFSAMLKDVFTTGKTATAWGEDTSELRELPPPRPCSYPFAAEAIPALR